MTARSPTTTLRQIAQITQNPQIRDLALQLAEDLRQQKLKTRNLLAAAVGDVRDELLGRMDDSDARQRQILAFLEELQQEMRDLGLRPTCRLRQREEGG